MPHTDQLSLPVLPLTNGVVFPHMVVTLRIETREGKTALEAARKAEAKPRRLVNWELIDPLLRAFEQGGEAVLTDLRDATDAARVVERIVRTELRLRFAYDDTSPAMHTVSRFDAEIAEQHYTEDTELVVRVRRSEADALRAAFVEALGGRGTVA